MLRIHTYVSLKDVKPLGSTTLKYTADTKLSIKGIIPALVILNGLNTPHSFIAVENLSVPMQHSGIFDRTPLIKIFY